MACHTKINILNFGNMFILAGSICFSRECFKIEKLFPWVTLVQKLPLSMISGSCTSAASRVTIVGGYEKRTVRLITLDSVGVR